MQLLDDLKETRGYWKLYEEAIDRSVCRTRFGRGYGPVIRQEYRINKYKIYKCGCGSHNTTWGPRVGYPCSTRTAWLYVHLQGSQSRTTDDACMTISTVYWVWLVYRGYFEWALIITPSFCLQEVQLVPKEFPATVWIGGTCSCYHWHCYHYRNRQILLHSNNFASNVSPKYRHRFLK